MQHRQKIGDRTIVTADNGNQYALLSRVDGDELNSLFRSYPALRRCGIATLKQIHIGKKRPYSLEFGHGRFSMAKAAKKYGPGATQKLFAVRKIKSAVALAENRVSIEREEVIKSTLRELALINELRRECDTTHLSLADDVVIALNSRGERQIYQFAELADLGNGENFLSILATSDLHEYDKHLIRRYLANILIKQVAELHRHNIFIRDIKIENTLVYSNGNFKVGDLGAAIKLDEAGNLLIEASHVAHARYMPPTELTASSSLKERCELHDLWAVGLTILQLYDDRALNELCKDYFSLSSSYISERGSFRNTPDTANKLTPQYQMTYRQLCNSPALNKIPLYLRQLVLTALNIESDKPSLLTILTRSDQNDFSLSQEELDAVNHSFHILVHGRPDAESAAFSSSAREELDEDGYTTSDSDAFSPRSLPSSQPIPIPGTSSQRSSGWGSLSSATPRAHTTLFSGSPRSPLSASPLASPPGAHSWPFNLSASPPLPDSPRSDTPRFF